MTNSPVDCKASMEKIERFFARFDKWLIDNKGMQFDADIMRNYTVIDASPTGSLTVELQLGKHYGNGAALLHGGAVGLIFDMFTTAAYIPRPEFDMENDSYVIPAGVSWTMNYTCLRPLPLPARVRVKAQVVHCGKKMNLIKGSIISLDETKTYYVCDHHKVNVSKLPQPRSIKI